ncbi:hypothetical protein HZS_1906 [Henneguya salminicola]|nr:hypothetical protein HZS_1906 [Henneguya salminicola]
MFTNMPLQSYGFNTLDSLLENQPQIAKPIGHFRGEKIYGAICDENTKAIAKLVSTQRGSSISIKEV